MIPSPSTPQVAFPPTGAEDEVHPLLNDDESKAPFVSGLRFGWLMLLTHSVEPVHAEVAKWADMLVTIDRGLLSLLRVPALSSDK